MFQYHIVLKKAEEYMKLYEETVKAKKKKEEKEKLIAISTKIENRYNEYLQNKNHLETMQKDEECCKLEKELKSCYEKNERVEEALNEIVKEQKLEIQHLCPLCELDQHNEKDHYLPKKAFPEYSIFMPNIIPSCSHCNKKKNDKILDENGNRQFFNIYFDKIPTIKILDAKIKFSEGIPYAEFSLLEENMKKNLTNTEIDVIKNHFQNLDLLHRYERASASEIAKRINTINIDKTILEEQIIKILYENNLKNNIKIYGINYWENVLDKEILENKFEELFYFNKETTPMV